MDEDDGTVIAGELLKWTNYIHGWQVRYFKLSPTGVISYSISPDYTDGCKGAIVIDKMILQLHEHTDVRFDMVTPSVTWFLRCHTAADRNSWVGIIHRQQKLMPDSREGSINQLNESSLETVSDLNIKLEELKSFKDSLSFQLSEIRTKLVAEDRRLSQQLATVQATVTGIVATTASCIELMQEREHLLHDKISSEREKSRNLEILYTATNRENSELLQNNDPQGPHLNDDQFFDAIEETLGKMESLENLSENNVIPYTPDNGAEHRMYKQMQDLIAKYVELSKEDPEQDASWQPLAKDGQTKIYRKEEEQNKVLLDYLVATTLVEGVTAGEMAEVFHSGELKLQWDHTIEADKLLETLDEHCAVYHQILKRVWPTAQRDLVYASHKQQLEAAEGSRPSWIVCNVSCDHPTTPEGTSGYTRATIEVVLFCETLCDKPDPTRSDIRCKIVYSASVNPGGWAPSAAVRAVSQREYPKFLKKISAFAYDHVKNSTIKF